MAESVHRHRLAKLALVGTIAGAFSGLFGVGGGVIIVPMLIFWFGYTEHRATGTSLATIVLMAVVGVALQGGYGNVDVTAGMLMGIPAIGGVIAGAALQQRLSGRAISLMFAGLLVVIAIDLLIRSGSS